LPSKGPDNLSQLYIPRTVQDFCESTYYHSPKDVRFRCLGKPSRIGLSLICIPPKPRGQKRRMKPDEETKRPSLMTMRASKNCNPNCNPRHIRDGARRGILGKDKKRRNP